MHKLSKFGTYSARPDHYELSRNPLPKYLCTNFKFFPNEFNLPD
jgi:hypothetical protein